MANEKQILQADSEHPSLDEADEGTRGSIDSVREILKKIIAEDIELVNPGTRK